MLDEMSLILGEFLPILDVLGQINLLCSPECCLLILVHLPDVMILNGEQHEPVGVLLEEGLRKWSLSLRVEEYC